MSAAVKCLQELNYICLNLITLGWRIKSVQQEYIKRCRIGLENLEYIVNLDRKKKVHHWK